MSLLERGSSPSSMDQVVVGLFFGLVVYDRDDTCGWTRRTVFVSLHSLDADERRLDSMSNKRNGE